MAKRVVVLQPGHVVDASPYAVHLRKELDRVCEFRGPPIEDHRAVLSGDVLHLNWLGDLARFRGFARTVAYLLAYKLRRRRIAWTVHNYRPHDPHPNLRERLLYGVGRKLVLQMADVVVTFCEDTRRRLLGELRHSRKRFGKKVIVIPHGPLDLPGRDLSKDAAKKSLGVGDRERVFLFFGQVRPYKNVDGLLEAFKEVAGPNDALVVAGKCPDRAYREKVERLANGDDRIALHLRFVPDDDVATYFRAADALVLPFREVTMTASFLLGATFGVPVVAPRVGCVPALTRQWVGNRNVLYDPREPGALSAAMRRFVEGSNERDQGGRGRGGGGGGKFGPRWREVARAHLHLVYG
ncbi:MAG: glycosyltransferase [Promethearchaeota archaeon]